MKLKKMVGNLSKRCPKPLGETVSSMQRYVNEVKVPCEEDLVEAQITWEIRKVLGCTVSNEKAVIEALTKIPECQDFIMPRKRGQLKKNKGQSKV